MITSFKIGPRAFEADLRQGYDLSLAVADVGPRAWYVDDPKIEPVMTSRFTGSVARGGAVNFFDVCFNPHGHGTHTECLGHITREKQSVNQSFKQWMLTSRVVSIAPVTLSSDRSEWVRAGDRVITPEQLALVMGTDPVDALIVRSLPNQESRKTRNYSESNPPYFLPESMDWLNKSGVQHLLTDLPSVDREEDGGLLRAHHVFWGVPEKPQPNKTITELIYVAEEIPDGLYLLNLQVAAIENDAAPSRPVIYPARS